ncbi:NAD-dependent succinate-semialdehyde dehydrogenase [Starkeya koreensis]|uniref:NAD-dependent succinate-semialdehyde dehydrogenase n=1 Tax=Ancylobacter koreensis TaxID=266121 RepID=A0ABT0DR13_9HYPH|nr:NAD-dependent succinate-semialdehyde dehydrogenase [Ancylobacter koreensis]MCK0209716.1 NAD-dependent succinate-semialdehyde dehydrogenase [Ancylobacter koreensis]
MFDSVNPATGAVLRSYAELSPADLERRVGDAVAAQRGWKRTPISERAALLLRLASVLREGVSRWAPLITQEMGKPIGEAEAEILKCAWCCEFYAGKAEEFLAPESAPSFASDSYVVFEPLGVLLAIMPWNFPFWQFFRFAAPALAAGNGMLLKHASNVPQCAEAIEQVFAEAGAPAGLMANLLVHHSKIAALIEDSRVAALTLTGSTEVGSLVAAQAGRALKKQVLELGGSDPFIVLADADIPTAAAFAVKARFHNAGQSCVCAKRFIVEEAVADAFVAAMTAEMDALTMGDPSERTVHVGPMARDNLRRDLAGQVERSMAAGAVLRRGGAPVDGEGFFFAPTLLDHVTPDMAVFREETFGPVAAIIRARDADEAIELANATEFGLGAALWTADVPRARALAREIEAGAVFINGQVASDPRLPFGGIKRSGYGRELSVYGLREFTNIKTVWIGPARPAA